MVDENKNEDKVIETKEDKRTSEDSDKGDKYETTPVIERAREEREKLELATKAQREENNRTEAIMARKALGGVTEAGQQAPEISEDQKKTDSAVEYFKDTQLAIDIKKANE